MNFHSPLVLTLSLFAAACSGEIVSDSAPACPTVEGTDAGAGRPDAAPVMDGAVTDGSAPATCSGMWNVVVDSIAPSAVGAEGGRFVTLHGKCFHLVVDVEVNIHSVGFTIVDDSTIVFVAPTLADVGGIDDVAPMTYQVDVLHNPADQDGAMLTYQ
jgi:hypothetical protein